MIPPLAPTFEAALRDVRAQQERFRGAAAARLADPPPERRDEAVEGLLVLAEDALGAVREAAYESLGALEAIEGLSILMAALNDSHPGSRQAAVLALGRVAPEEGSTAILALLDDPRPEMRFSAVWTLTSIGTEHADQIATALKDEDGEVRVLAAQCLGDLGATDHADEIAALLDDPLEPVRFGAATALAAFGDERGAPPLRLSLAHPERTLPAALGLGNLKDRASLPELRRLAIHRWRSPILRAAAARALAQMEDPAGTEVIRKIIRSWRMEARLYAVEIAGELGLSSLIPDLAQALRRSRKNERPVYETALEQLAVDNPDAKALLASMREANQHP